MTTPAESTGIETIFLERLKVGCQQVIPRGILDSMQLSIEPTANFLVDGMVMRLKAELLAEKLPPERLANSKRVTWTTPATWWDHLKETYAGKWWTRWMKAPRTIEHSKLAEFNIELQRYWVYPDARPLPRDQFGSPVRVCTVTESSWWTR